MPLVNLALDPRGVLPVPEVPRFNAEKPERIADRRRTTKSLALRLQPYDSLVLGSSRVLVGIDPQHGTLGSRHTYNAGLPGTSMREQFAVFEYAREFLDLRTIVFGADFLMFSRDRPLPEDFARSAFAGKGRLGLYARYAVSTHTLRASWETLKDNVRGRPATGRADGFIDRSRRRRRRGRHRPFDHRALFDLACRDYFVADGHVFEGFVYDAEQMALLRRLVRECRRQGIALYLFIPPVHARHLEGLARTGLFPVFEKWMADMAVIVDEARAVVPGAAAFALWDFSAYHEITTERVPRSDEAGTRMTWYWDASHYTATVGNLMLDRMFAVEPAEGTTLPAFGAPLLPDDLEARLAALRRGRARYQATHPFEVSEVGRLFAAAP